MLKAEHVISRLSYPYLGMAVGVSQDTIRNWGKNDGAPTSKQLAEMCAKMELAEANKTRLYEAYVKTILDKITVEDAPTKTALAVAKMVSAKSKKTGLQALAEQETLKAAVPKEILDALQRVMERAKNQQQL